MPKLSLIMPVYNTEAYIRDSISSIINQTFRDFELIIVNDCSTDGSLELCREFEAHDERVTVLDKSINEGAGKARNDGIKLATGQYVAFPDSDDWLDLNAYQTAVERMERDDADLLVFGSVNEVYDEKGCLIEETLGASADLQIVGKKQCREKWVELVTTLPMDGPSNKIYRKSIIDEHQLLFPGIRCMEDGIFNMMYFDHIYSLTCISAPLYHYRQKSWTSLKKRLPTYYLECSEEYYWKAVELLKEWECLTEEKEIKLGKWHLAIISVALFGYIPEDANSIRQIYSYIRKTNNDERLSKFYRSFRRHFRSMSKTQLAMVYRLNAVLAIKAWLNDLPGYRNNGTVN